MSTMATVISSVLLTFQAKRSIILHGIDDNLGGYDLAIQLDIRLGSTNDSAFLVLIIILFSARNVNRTGDITVAIVDIEKLRTS